MKIMITMILRSKKKHKILKKICLFLFYSFVDIETFYSNFIVHLTLKNKKA